MKDYNFRFYDELINAGLTKSKPPASLLKLMNAAENASKTLKGSGGNDNQNLLEILAQVDAVICAAIHKETERLALKRTASIDQDKLQMLKQLALQRKNELNKK